MSPSHGYRRRPPPVTWLLALVLLLILPAGGSAQTGAWPASRPYSATFLSPSHWSTAALQRLDGLGLLPHGFDATRSSFTQQEIGSALAYAVAAAADAPDGYARLAQGYAGRFRDELALQSRCGERRCDPGLLALLRGSGIAAGYADRSGALRAGWGYEDGYYNGADWNEPTPAAAPRAAFAAATAQLSPAPWLGLRARGSIDGDSTRLEELHGVLRWRAIVLWGGRRELGYGLGQESIVLDQASVDGGGVHLAHPVRLPWLLRYLGPVSFDAWVSSVDMPRSFDDMVFFGTRGAISPHRRLRLGVTRAGLFGGDGNTDVDAFAIFSVLIGKHAGEISELDNQVVSVDVQWRPPTERVLPLRLYTEWGFEDSANAWRNVPGVLAGLEVPALPGLPQVGLGLEYAVFARSCCGNPIWYRHSVLQDGWTRDGRPLGHSLGGHGHQWSALLRADLADARLRIGARPFVRHRRRENLFAPDRQGSSTGAALGVEYDVTRSLRLDAESSIEEGDDWRESAVTVALKALF